MKSRREEDISELGRVLYLTSRFKPFITVCVFFSLCLRSVIYDHEATRL